MHLTKFEHSTMVLTADDGSELYIDPGSFARPVPASSRAVAIVISHEHADHWTPEQLDRILAAAPGTPIYAPQGVADAASGYDVTVVQAGDTVQAGPFTLRFFGGRHAVIHRSIPVVDNLGVLVDDTLFYPGDSFTVPEGIDVDVLAVPASAPWLKAAEFMDYVLEVAPRRSFPVHECVNSDLGNQMAFARIKQTTEEGGGTFLPVTAGDEVDL